MNLLNGGRLGVIFTRASSSAYILRPFVLSHSLSSLPIRPSPSAPRRLTHVVVFPTSSNCISSYYIRTYKLRRHIRMASSLTLPRLPVFNAIAGHDPNSFVVVHCLSGRTFRYGELLPDVCRARDRIYAAAGKSDIRGERVAFLVENSYDYVGMCGIFVI